MIYPPNSPCIVCHDKGDWQKKAKLLKMEQLCSSLSESAEIRHSPDMGLRVHSRCRYGLSCTALTSFDNECNLMARQLSGKLAAAAVSEETTRSITSFWSSVAEIFLPVITNSNLSIINTEKHPQQIDFAYYVIV